MSLDHYKSWSSLNKWLGECLCDELKDRITYFLTQYHKVHNSYGRAAIRLDGKELVCFSWIERCRQEYDVSEKHLEDPSLKFDEIYDAMKAKWDGAGTYCEMDFLDAVLHFRNLSIPDALNSDDYLIRILAILDQRVGKRTLRKISESGDYRILPQWARQFYELRLSVEKIV